MSYGDFRVPTKRDTYASNAYIEHDIQLLDFPVNRDYLIDCYDKYKTGGVFIYGGKNIKLLELLKNEPLWSFKHDQKKKWLTTLNGVDISKFWSSKDLENAITIFGVNYSEYKPEENNDKETLDIEGPYHLLENTRGAIKGSINMINTSHPGLEFLGINKDEALPTNQIKKIESLGENLEAGDIVEFYVPYYNQDHDNFDPTDEQFWENTYKYTFPYNLRNSKKLTIRYRKIYSGEEEESFDKLKRLYKQYTSDLTRPVPPAAPVYTFKKDNINVVGILNVQREIFNFIFESKALIIKLHRYKMVKRMVVLKGGKFGESVTFSVLI